MTLYEELEVEKTATPEEIKKAYRKKSKQVHPDHNPDDPKAAEKFGELTKAYDILIDEEKRKRYDAGEDPDAMRNMKTPRDMAVHAVMNLFSQVIEQVDENHTDIFSVMKERVHNNISKFKGEIKRGENQIRKYQSAMKRISHKKKSQENIFIQSLEAQIRSVEGGKAQFEEQIKIAEIALTIIDDYKYQVDEDLPTYGQPMNRFTIGGIWR
ncbi:J domain-containing protein [Nitrospiraceae bacterium HYJII51-Mn-bac16s-1-B09]|uniref:J domain-containing protein n=1 Tax=Candidatus Manganitrophus noduliformans TaxID=2606439 RepID=A0A7X6DMI7_9BACT|nr:DnaJ domain-containing protein [Candidatus Manganitrophus noduliformans]NKE69842.1 J domain-containing protein [Candidatus Manganitrophus noduliformans]